MADKFTLRGVKRIQEYKEPAAIGDRKASLRRPNTGKDQFTIKRWWTEAGTRIPKRYINVTAIDIDRSGDNIILAVASTQDTRLDVIFDDPSTLTFGEIHSVAEFLRDYQVLRCHWFSASDVGKSTTRAGDRHPTEFRSQSTIRFFGQHGVPGYDEGPSTRRFLVVGIRFELRAPSFGVVVGIGTAGYGADLRSDKFKG